MKLTHPVVALGLLALVAVAGAIAYDRLRARPVPATVQIELPGDLGHAPQQIEREPAPSPDFERALAAAITRWDDALQLASTTPRMSLPPVVSDMQAQRRALDPQAFGPCLAAAGDHLGREMDSTIKMFLLFLGSPDLAKVAYDAHVEARDKHRRNLETVRNSCTTRT